MALVDQFGRQIRRGRPILEEIGGVGGIRDRYSTYPSQGLTPERLASIFKQADLGDVSRQAELFEEMEEKDAHLGSVLQTRKLAVAGLEWEVTAASEDREDEDIAAFVREALGWVENLDDALLDVLDALGKGFSISEIMWELDGNRVWAKELRWRHPKRFTFYANDRILDFPRLLTDADLVYGEELPPNKFIYHRYKSRSGIAPRAGILRPCAWMYLFKNYDVKDWVVFNERFAMPMRVGKYNQSTSPDDRDVLKEAVFNLGADAAAVVSDSTVIELLESAGKTGSAAIFEKLADFCDRAMSKAVLGHTGSADSTPGKLGAEHEARDVRQDLLEADSKALAKAISMQLIYPLVGFNFGFDKNIPRFRFHHEEDEDLGQTAETYKTLAEMGFDGIPKKHIYEKFGIPEPAKGEETVQPPSAPPAFKEDVCSCGKAHPPGGRRVVLKRSDEWVDAYLERIAPSLKGVREEAVRNVEAWLKSQPTPPSKEVFISKVKDILGESFSKIDRAAITDVVTEIYNWHKTADLFAPGVEVAFGGADVRAVEFLSRLDHFYLSKWITNADAERSVVDFLGERYLQGGEGLFGRGDPRTVQELKDLLSQKLVDLSEGKVDRIVDTAVQRNRNWAHVSQMSDAGIPEIKVYEPTRDCPFCEAMDGRVIHVPTAYGRMRSLAEMSPEDYEAELKANPPVALPDNVEAFLGRGELPPYHPYCHGRIVRRVR
jgi:phage gp29-like protein